MRPPQGGREQPGPLHGLRHPAAGRRRADRQADLPLLLGRAQDRAAALRPLRRRGRAEDEVHPQRVPAEGLHLRRPAAAQSAAHLLGEGRHDQDQAAQAHQGAGGLLRRHRPDDREGDLHLQRHRAGRRLASCSARRASSSARARPRATSSPSSSRTAGPGSSSSTTSRTTSTSGWTARRSSWPPSSCGPWASAPTRTSSRSSTASIGWPPRATSSTGTSPTAWPARPWPRTSRTPRPGPSWSTPARS